MKETLGEVPATLVEPKVGASTILFSRLARAVRARRRPFVLVFDDVHVLRNRECLEALTVIIDQLPSGAQARARLANRTRPETRPPKGAPWARRAEATRSGDDAIRGWRPAGADGSQAGSHGRRKALSASRGLAGGHLSGRAVASRAARRRQSGGAVCRRRPVGRRLPSGRVSGGTVATQARVLDAHLGARHARRPRLRRRARAIGVGASASRARALEHAPRSTRSKRPRVPLPLPLRGDAQGGTAPP